MANELFVLTEIDNLNAIFGPLKSTHRIKYTCFTVSRNFLIFGATSGGLYVFKREPCIFLHLLPNKEGSITQVSVSPDEKYFAFATVKGVVCILEQSQSLKFRRVQTSAEHHGSEVTALQWNACRSELFVGDDSGRISVISSSAFVGKNMFQTPSFILMRLDSRIIQLDWCSELLLISTLSRCYVCDTVKERYRQIGHKLREGEYGACFYVTGDRRDLPSRYEHRGSKTGGAFSSLSADEKFACCEGLQNLKMFCARPGSRLWKVKTDGTVLSTHHFKQALAIPPTNITGPHDMQRVGGSVLEATQNEECGRQSFNFTKLFIIAKKFIFTFKRDGIYILDPDKGSVILWNNSFKDIVDAKTLDDAVYIWTASGRMHALLMLPLDRVLVRLYLRKEYALCAHLCGLHHKYLMELATASSKLQILADLGTKLKDSEVARTIHPLLQEIRKFAREKQNVQRLKSGIFLVENKQFFCSKEGENGESLKSHLCVRSTKEKSRSLSASPESNRRKKNGASRRERKSVSVTSLPELAFRSNGLSTEDGTQPYHRLRAKHDSSGDALVFKSGDLLSSSDSAFHPEGVQVLKELKYSVSWKSLKEKWKMLEGKMKLLNQDTVLEPFDIRPSDYQEAVLDEECSNEHVELVHSYGDKSRPRESHFPVLDVSNITDLCNLFVTCEQNGADKSELVCELLNAICTIYELFIRALLKTDFNIVDDGTLQISKLGRLSNLKSEFNVTGTFPFAYYFADDTVKIIRDEFHLALKTKSLITWLQNRVQDVRLQHTDRLPEHLKDFYSEDAVKLDIILSNILVIFSELFDPSLMLQYVQTSELSCYYFSLCVILDRYEEGNLYCTGDGTSGQAAYDEMPPPLLLSTIFFMFGVERVETCCKLSKRVSVKDVWYLIMRLLQYAESNGNRESAKSHCYSLFLSYLEKMPASSDCLSKVFSDDHLRLYATVAFEEVNSVANGSCVCGFPVICSKTMLYPDLAKVLVSYYWDSNQGRLIELCKKVPSLWHLILPRKEDGGFSSVLPLIIHLGDTLELEKWLPTMDHDAWSRTLDLLAVFRSGTCVNCGSVFATSKDQLGGMLWSSVGPLMVKALGPHEAVQLMTKYASHIAPGELGVRFFQSCIYSAIIDNHARGLRNEVIAMLNACSKEAAKTALFSPVVCPSVEEALKEDLGKHVQLPIASEKYHWGVKVNMVDGNCPFCSLPLGSLVLMKDGGVMTFRCGHSYHVVCLERQTQRHTCPICVKNS